MNQDSDALRVLLLPVASAPEPWDLLVPASAVAELVNAEPLEAPGPGAPQWLCGYLTWRGLRLPLIRPTTGGGRTGAYGAHAYAAVCFAPAGEPTAAFFAIESQGMPRLERVTPETLSAEMRSPDQAHVDYAFIQVALRVQGRLAGLVDLDAVEHALLATVA